MSNTEQIRIGIIGAGKNTREQHIPKLRAHENVQIVSVANRTLASSQQAASSLNIPKAYSNWRELIYADDIDAVVIGTWPYLHHPATLAALEAGKHVMVEARMAMNAKEAHEMLMVAKQHPALITQVVPAPMTLHLDTTIKRLLAESYLGDVIAIELRANGNFPNFEAPLHWRNDMNLSGLNIMGMGIWYESIMRWLGPARTVMAMGKTVVNPRRDSNNQLVAVQIPDYIHVMANMVCNAQLHMRLSNVTGLENQDENLTLYGTNGTLQIRDGKLYGGQRDEDELAEIPIPENENTGWRVEDEFIRAIRGLEAITHTTFSDGVAYMEFTEAVHRSMASQCSVSLPLL